MKLLRPILSILVLALLAAGYAASQMAAIGGTAETYAKKVDQPLTQWIALSILVLCIVFAFMRDQEADDT